MNGSQCNICSGESANINVGENFFYPDLQDETDSIKIDRNSPLQFCCCNCVSALAVPRGLDLPVDRGLLKPKKRTLINALVTLIDVQNNTSGSASGFADCRSK